MVGNVPLESEEQRTFFELAEHTLTQEQYKLLFAVLNGGKRHIRTAINLKREGVKAGVPDIIFAYPSGQFHGLFIELKRRKGGTVSEEQKEMIELLRHQGYCAVVCKGCDEALEVLSGYISLDHDL